jgi:hypothetical protein
MVAELRRIGVTPHVAQNTARPGGSAIDGRTTRHEGYAKSINARRGTEKVSAVFELHVIAYNLIRLGNLLRPAIAAA